MLFHTHNDNDMSWLREEQHLCFFMPYSNTRQVSKNNSWTPAFYKVTSPLSGRLLDEPPTRMSNTPGSTTNLCVATS